MPQRTFKLKRDKLRLRKISFRTMSIPMFM